MWLINIFMNPKLPLNGCIYTLTVGSVLTTNVSQIQSMPTFVQIYSQSQARLMFVTTLGLDNFDCTNKCTFRKMHSLSKLRILVKVQPSTRSTWPWSPTIG